MKKALELAILNALSYMVLTFDIRSVSQANIPVAIVVNVILAWLSFDIVKRISCAKGNLEKIGYIVGGVIGVISGITFSKIVLGK